MRSAKEVATPASGQGGFVHLHLHSEYSLLDGGNRLDRLLDRVAELGMDAVAVTDHGNLFGAMSFYQQAKKRGIKPILGIEAYVAPGDRRDRTHTGVMDGGYHLVLLAENRVGWQNLLYLSSEAYLSGFYYRPRMDHALLEQHSEGLIAINGHLGSELAFHLVEYEKTGREEHYEQAVEVARWHHRVFAPTEAGDRFFVELQHHIPEQIAINKHLLRLAEELELPVVCDNDSHFLLAEDWDAHDTLICIATGKTKDDENRLRYPRDLYVKSPEEMRELFEREYGEVGREACDNTVRIAERCNVEIDFENHAPLVKVVRPERKREYEEGRNLTEWFKSFCEDYELLPYDASGGVPSREELEAECDAALRDLCEAGMVWRYGPEIADPANTSEDARAKRARLERELGILADKHISAYFLIVWDFVNWARQRGIPANARGSGVGTMVGYVLGLSNACPVRYGLLFERFTDPDRSEYPDIDIDLCQDGRADVINYVREKYGHVAQIITFGTLKARAAVRDVGRVFGMPLPDVDRVAKLIPEQLGVTLEGALEQEPDLRKLYDEDAQVKRVIDTGKVIEGQARHASVHAAGVIVATRPLHEIVPLYRPPGSEDVVTQWDGPTCERVGLLKMDFLGLRTLSTIERAKQLIRETLDEEAIWRSICTGRESLPSEQERARRDPLDLDRLVFDDQRVFDLFRRADTTGVFQFESGGMRRLLTEMKPDRLEDLIAANALFRPGPMDLIPDYNARKHGQAPVPSIHEIVDRFTAETYGVMVYQEQVMQIVHHLGGIPLRAAYALIKAISKKKHDVIDSNRATFVQGAQAKGLSEQQAEELFELILKFAGYGFNKSHSTGYAIIAYQTAFLKTYFPNQYMAAFLTFESQAQKVEDWIKYKDDCRRTLFPDGRVGVDVLPPDVNLSDADFTVVFDEDEPRDALHGHVRFGLKAIKGVGAKAIDHIVAERRTNGPFRSLYDFCERMAPGTVNKATIEALVVCGAFDSVHGAENRAAMVATIESAVSAGQSVARDKAAGQSSLFGGGGDAPAGPREAPEPVLARAEPWDELTKLAKEKEALGFYVSSHPLERYAPTIERFSTAQLGSLRSAAQQAEVVLAGLIKSVRPIVTRSGRNPGQKMAIVTLENEQTSVECVLFTKAYAEYGPKLRTDAVVFMRGTVDHSRGDPQVIVEEVIGIEEAPARLARGVELVIDERRHNGAATGTLEHVRGIVGSNGMSTTDALRVPLTIVVQAGGMEYVVRSAATTVAPTPDVIRYLREAVGDDNVRIVGARD